MKIIMLALLVACGTNTLPEHPAPGAPKQQRVAAVLELTKDQWDRSGYARAGEIVSYPVFLLVSDFALACIVPDKDWALGEYFVQQWYSCADGWRFRRSR